MLGKTLAQYCPNDSAMKKEQKRIEKELADFESNLWGHVEKKDSTDSIAPADKKSVKAKKAKNRRTGSAAAKVKKPRNSSGSSSGSGASAARVSVRRQRH